jgi:hypothetical protein
VEKRVAGAVFLKVAKSFGTLWNDGLPFQANDPKFTDLPRPHILIITSGSDV